MSVLSTNGIELHYQIHGDGPALFLLHGFFGAGIDWAPFLDAFRDHRLIVPDLRGHGRSNNPSRAFTFRESAADVLALADALEIERFRAIGLSGGGNTLLHVATAASARVESMVLVSATTHFPEEARALQRSFRYDALPPGERAAMRARHVRGDEQLEMLLEQAHRFADSYDDLCFTPDSLRRIRARTLVVHGDRDPFYPVEIALDLYRGIRDAALWVVPEEGHSPIFGGARDELVRVAGGFLRRN